jgi:hypothetical protein
LGSGQQFYGIKLKTVLECFSGFRVKNVAMLLCRGVRAFFAVKAKQQLYEAHLNRLYLLHNLNNNAGVISQCLDEANEQVGTCQTKPKAAG